MFLTRISHYGFFFALVTVIQIFETATADVSAVKESFFDSAFSKLHRINQREAANVGWPKIPKLNIDKIDVKTQIDALNFSYVYEKSWPDESIKLGAVTAVSSDREGNIVIFHRVDRIWSQNTFDQSNVFTERSKGPISKNTVLAINRENGKIVYEWGKNLFYMPHGLTIDHEDNAWVTDVALHQVFKFGPKGSGTNLTLGQRFSPGAGKKFCKPTSVAVLKNGDFFVADGYCNARIIKYNRNGEEILSWGQNSFSGTSFEVAPANYFAIPHALTLVPEQNLICAADRENGRIQCFFWTNGTFHSQYHNEIIGDRLFSMDYSPAAGGQFVVVNGPTPEYGHNVKSNEVYGFILNISNKQVISKFGPNDIPFRNPHDVAISDDGKEIYVAELDPRRIHKFVQKSNGENMIFSGSSPIPSYSELAMHSSESESHKATDSAEGRSHPGGTAILVASLMLLFAFLTFTLALLIARRRKQGSSFFGIKDRRHAWDSSHRFKLNGGLLLDRKKRNGFEKLDQNASDEENETSANARNHSQLT